MGTIARELVVIRNLFYQARKWKKFFGDNPVTQSGMPEVHDQKERVLTPDEEKRLLSVCPKYLQDIINIALNTGMRLGEILGMKWEWIDLKDNFIFIPQTNTKNKKIKKVPINQLVRKIILERKIQTIDSVFVFPSKQSQNGHLNWVKRSFKAACKKAGIDDLRFHDLRHSCATRLVEAGVPLHTVAKLLGHSTVRMTERYSHPEESLKGAVEILANLGNRLSQV